MIRPSGLTIIMASGADSSSPRNFSFRLRGEDFVGNVLGDQQVADVPVGGVEVGSQDRAGKEAQAVLTQAGEDTFPLAVAKRAQHDLTRPAGGDILGDVEDVRRGLAEDFLPRLVAVQPPCPFIPQQNGPIEAQADEGIVRGRLEDVDDELQRVLRTASHEGGVEEHGIHGQFLWGRVIDEYSSPREAISDQCLFHADPWRHLRGLVGPCQRREGGECSPLGAAPRRSLSLPRTPWLLAGRFAARQCAGGASVWERPRQCGRLCRLPHVTHHKFLVNQELVAAGGSLPEALVQSWPCQGNTLRRKVSSRFQATL